MDVHEKIWERCDTYGEIQRLYRLARDISAHIPAVTLVEQRVGRELVDVIAKLSLCLALDVERGQVVVAHILDELAHPLGLHFDRRWTIRIGRGSVWAV